MGSGKFVLLFKEYDADVLGTERWDVYKRQLTYELNDASDVVVRSDPINLQNH